MLQPHSFLWHYLWLGPHVLQAILAVVLWRRGTHKRFPFFFAYLIYEASEELTLWLLDWLPGVSAEAWWSAFCVGVAIEGMLKFAFVLELFFRLVRARPDVVNLSKWLIGCAGAAMVALAAWAAAHAPIAHQLPIVSYAHTLGQAVYIIGCGLWLLIFLFAAYFHIAWNSWDFGIALGSSISTCVHLATWAVFANIGSFEKGYLLDFLNMSTYHVCVLIWFYYLLLPLRPSAAPVRAVSETETSAPPVSLHIRKLRPELR